jgi:hypothetical protein
LTSKLLLVALMGAVLPGCARQPDPDPTQTRLGWLGSMYGRYIGQSTGEAPKSIDELRKFVAEKTTPDQLTRLGVANAEELFVSPRDGKPFVMVTLAKRPPPGTGSPLVVLYEAEGVGGQRAVAFLGGTTEVVDSSKFSQILPKSAG